MKKIISIIALLCALLPARAQYMSFFGDSTWEYHVTYITQPPETYLTSPPEVPNPLGVYCRTYSFRYRRDCISGVTHHYDPITDVGLSSWCHIHENINYGRLFLDEFLVCDMSLSEGDTFVLINPCVNDTSLYDYPEWLYDYDWFFDSDSDRYMIVDSVNYLSGRKTIYLSLLDHLDDYFFGSENTNNMSNNNFSIRFIEGVGATFGFAAGCRSISYSSDRYPSLGLLLCLSKDNSIIYMADEALGCNQTCVGLKDNPQIQINLYPNPATQYVVLDMGTGEEMTGTITITDMMGKVCLQQQAEGASYRVNVGNLPVGMYFLTYTDREKKMTKKFLKG